MKKFFNLLYIIPALALVGCSNVEDEIQNFPEVNKKYTVCAKLPEMTRVSYTDDSSTGTNTMKLAWEAEDVITLTKEGSEKTYVFKIEEVGDIISDGSATFTYQGSDDIEGASSFSGQFIYAPIDEYDEDGNAIGNNTEHQHIQTANGSTGHLKYCECMVAEVEEVDLTTGNYNLTFTHPNTSVFKIIFKAPSNFGYGSLLEMRGAWAEDAKLTLNFEGTQGTTYTTYLIYGAGSINAGDILSFHLHDKTDGRIYNYEMTVNNTVEFTNGKFYKADISNATMALWYGNIPDEGVVMANNLEWAPYNIGAPNEFESGYYLAWGELAPSATYNWTTYLGEGIKSKNDCGGSSDKLKIYINSSNYPNGISGTDFDAAHVKWGNGWRMPTEAEFLSLISSCDITYYDGTTTKYKESSTPGLLFKLKNSPNTELFLPEVGINNNKQAGQLYYWTASATGITSKYSSKAFKFKDNTSNITKVERFNGLPIRPVRTKSN